MSRFQTPVGQPHRPSPVVEFIPVDNLSFKLDAELRDEVGVVACVTRFWRSMAYTSSGSSSPSWTPMSRW